MAASPQNALPENLLAPSIGFRACSARTPAARPCGVIDKTAGGKLVFPYDAVHVDFMRKAA